MRSLVITYPAPSQKARDLMQVGKADLNPYVRVCGPPTQWIQTQCFALLSAFYALAENLPTTVTCAVCIGLHNPRGQQRQTKQAPIDKDTEALDQPDV